MCGTLLSLSIALFALLPQEPKILNVRFSDETFARVRVLGIQGDRVKLRELVFDSSIDVYHDLADFEPASAFRIEMEARRPATFEEHFAMAQRAAELGLPAQAGDQAAAAIREMRGHIDAEKKARVVRTWAADALDGWLNEALSSRDLAASIHYLEMLSTRFADLRSEEQLDLLADAVERLERDRAARRQAERQARLDAKVRATIEKRLEPIHRAVERGDALYREAIRKSRNMTQSANLSTRAIDTYRAAWRAAVKLQKQHPEDQSLIVEIESLANHVHDHAIRAGLHAANMLTVRGDYGGATEWVGKVLALDPSNAEAKTMQRTIAIASAAAGGGWGWGGVLVVPSTSNSDTR